MVTPKNQNRKKPPVSAVLGASLFFVLMDVFSLLPTAIIAYANLEINIPKCRKMTIPLHLLW